MTFVETLKQTEKAGKIIVSEKSLEKYSTVWTYQVLVVDPETRMAMEVWPCAKATWRKRFESVLSACR